MLVRTEEYDQVLVLRSLPDLSNLTLKLNRLCDSHYPGYILAHLPRLLYLDHAWIGQEERSMAIQRHRTSVEDVETAEEESRQEEAALKQKKASSEKHQRAGVLALNDGSLSKMMFEDDIDTESLLTVSGAQTVVKKFCDSFDEVCLRVFHSGLEHEKQRETELRLLQESLQGARRDANEEARTGVCNLESHIGRLVEKARQVAAAEEASVGDDQEEHESRVKDVDKIKQDAEGLIADCTDTLMASEILLADQIKEVVDLAEGELNRMVDVFLEAAGLEFAEGRRLAYTFYCRLRELATAVIADSQSCKGRVFSGADTLAAALARIHDRHLLMINTREEELRSHLRAWLQETLSRMQSEEWQRHRRRVQELLALGQRNRTLVLEALPSFTED